MRENITVISIGKDWVGLELRLILRDFKAENIPAGSFTDCLTSDCAHKELQNDCFAEVKLIKLTQWPVCSIIPYSLQS